MKTKNKRIVGFLLIALVIIFLILGWGKNINSSYVGSPSAVSIISSNLEQFKIASFLYMDEYDVNYVSYSDVFGPGKTVEKHLVSCIGEDYNDLSISDTDTLIVISTNETSVVSKGIESYKAATANKGIQSDPRPSDR